MSPKVERIQSRESLNTRYFTVDLESPDEFEFSDFDNFAASVYARIGGGAMYFIKYIIASNIMYIFKTSEEHKVFSDVLRLQSIQSAGFIESVRDSQEVWKRTIRGSSSSLSIPQEFEKRYKDEFLQEKIGAYFEIL